MRNALFAFVMMALPTFAAAALPNGAQHSAASYRFIGLPIYDARLFTRAGAPLDWADDFSIELTYNRNLTLFDLVEGTLREMTRFGASLPAREKLETRDNTVRNGDRYLALTHGPYWISFWMNGTRTFTLNHPQIKRGFMAAFPSENTLSKSFTHKLKDE